MTEFLDAYDALQIVEGLGFYVKDLGLLEAAIARPQASAFGEDAYKTLELKASALAHSIVKNHALVDGNKRTTWVILNAFLYVNGFTLKMTTKEGFDFILALATDEFSLDEAAKIIRKHLLKLK
jgi:death-on-curing protein